MRSPIVGPILGMDHAVIAVRDLEAAGATFTRLGFTVTPAAYHAEWGTANRCLMFADDYVELIAAVGEGEVAGRVAAFTRDREGLMAVAVGVADAAAAVGRLRSRGLDVEAPRPLSRLAGDLPARFEVAMLPPEATPGMPAWLCRHLSPEALRQPGWLDHANGALGIASVTAVLADPPAAVAAWERVFGAASATLTDEMVAVHTGHGTVFLTHPQDLDMLHPAADEGELPAPPALVVLSLTVADTGHTARLLDAADIEYDRDVEGTLRIPAAAAHGVLIELAASKG
jgi:catechol 2,3-dioxygenase-like lactoylglutathione lyase family enzyme